MKDPLGVSPGKGNQGTTRGKEKNSFDLGGNQTLSTHTHIVFYVVKKSQYDKNFCRIKFHGLQDLLPAVLSQRLFSIL